MQGITGRGVVVAFVDDGNNNYFSDLVFLACVRILSASYTALALAHISARSVVGAERTQSLMKFVAEHAIAL